ncbi:unnamed protein product [Protopolystoma xenopodis]|uniref:Uncharacterized protein n=1 Tax=Protopolystoma xenopodis TaxID=117903 RepID=A0A3S5A3I9_9PLAT|nr:unnamed protein product [Protopolystoma xenopodis]
MYAKYPFSRYSLCKRANQRRSFGLGSSGRDGLHKRDSSPARAPPRQPYSSAGKRVSQVGMKRRPSRPVAMAPSVLPPSCRGVSPPEACDAGSSRAPRAGGNRTASRRARRGHRPLPPAEKHVPLATLRADTLAHPPPLHMTRNLPCKWPITLACWRPIGARMSTSPSVVV